MFHWSLRILHGGESFNRSESLIDREELRVEKQPDKTSVGWIAAGFEFLGYHINCGSLVGSAKATCERLAARINQLYEQGAE